MKKNPGQLAQIADRRATAVQMYADGATLDCIGETLHRDNGTPEGYSRPPGPTLRKAVTDDVYAAKRRARAVTDEAVTNHRAKQGRRLDLMWAIVESNLRDGSPAVQIAAVHAGVRLMDRHAKLYGTDQVQPETGSGDLSGSEHLRSVVTRIADFVETRAAGTA